MSMSIDGFRHVLCMMQDPPSVVAARALQERHIERWIQEARRAPQRAGGGGSSSGVRAGAEAALVASA